MTRRARTGALLFLAALLTLGALMAETAAGTVGCLAAVVLTLFAARASSLS